MLKGKSTGTPHIFAGKNHGFRMCNRFLDVPFFTKPLISATYCGRRFEMFPVNEVPGDAGEWRPVRLRCAHLWLRL